MKTTALKARLRAHILSGGALKEFASDEKLHPTTPGKMLEGLGIRKVFLTEEEREMVAKMRRESALAQRNGVPAERDQLRDERNNLRADLDAIKAIRDEETARAERAEALHLDAIDEAGAQAKMMNEYRLRAERAEAELAAERARLDWLLSRMSGNILLANKCVAWTVDVYHYGNRFPSRDAIDAAIKEETK